MSRRERGGLFMSRSSHGHTPTFRWEKAQKAQKYLKLTQIAQILQIYLRLAESAVRKATLLPSGGRKRGNLKERVRREGGTALSRRLDGAGIADLVDEGAEDGGTIGMGLAVGLGGITQTGITGGNEEGDREVGRSEIGN